MAFSTELENIPKTHMEVQRPQMVTVIISIESSGRGQMPNYTTKL